MHHHLLFILTLLISNSALFAKELSKKNPINLFCGHIHYGCEDVDTDTFKIEILNSGKVQVIRQFHRSDLPLTSAFVGKLAAPTIISAKFDSSLTKKNSKTSQSISAEGEIIVTLSCADIATYKDCKVNAQPTSNNKALSKFPGWDKAEGDVTNLSCNLKAFSTNEATEKDCTDE